MKTKKLLGLGSWVLGLGLLTLSVFGQGTPIATTAFTRTMLRGADSAAVRTSLGFLSTNNTVITNYEGNGASITNLNASELRSGTVPLARLSGITATQIADSTITTNKVDATAYAAFTASATDVTQAGLAAGSYPIDGGALIFFELYSAWVSKYGDNSTGTVGKRERPFAGVSNAVYAVKTALGSANTNGVVYIGTGLFDEHLVNLQRTNLPGISLIGQGGIATLLTSQSTSQLTNIGALVTVGHSSRVIGVSISNDMSANFKQAAIGYDTSRSASLLGTMVVPTNVFINVPVGRGNSDVGYFYDAAGPGDFDITMSGCDWLSKWDAVFLSTLGTDGQFKIKQSSIKVLQPDGYNFPGLGSGAGRARAVYIGDGNLSVENSLIVAVGGTTSTNEVTGLTFFGATIGYTNIGSFIDAQGSAGTILKESTSEITQYLGKLDASAISGSFGSISNSGKYNGIKVYRATITQTGTAAPVATVLENSLGATPTWARTGVGTYTVSTSALFTSAKTATTFTQSTSSSGGFHLGTVEWATTSQIILRTVDDAQVGGLADAIINGGSNIEILVYP